MGAVNEKPRTEKKSAYRPVVPAVDQACRILFCLSKNDHQKMGLTDICKEVAISKSKGFSILNTFLGFGLVEKDRQTKTYALGSGLLSLSRQFLNNLSYPQVVAPFLQQLAIETNGTALFGFIDGDYLLIIGKHEGNQNIGFTVRQGHRFHLTLGAHGKAIAAFLPEGERERILKKKKAHFYLDPARLDPERLREELSTCRQQGFAQDPGEITPGVNVISSPLFSHQDKLIGCLIVMGTFQEDKIQEYGPKLALLARQISVKLGANVDRLYLCDSVSAKED